VELIGGHAAALQETEEQEFGSLAVPKPDQEEGDEKGGDRDIRRRGGRAKVAL
jgi:hypothetical protein